MRSLVIASCLLLSLALAACDSTNPDDGGSTVNPTSISGDWVGEIVSQGDTISVEINMTQSVNNISGSGRVVSTTFGARPFDILPASSYFHPNIGLELLFAEQSVGQPMGDLNGVVATERDNIRGTMVGPGFSGPAELDLVLTRMQP